jgi:hypothetical protein
MAYEATIQGGELTEIPNCRIIVPRGNTYSNIGDTLLNFLTNTGLITFNAMPTISDTKAAKYTEDFVMGRATPITSYSYSQARMVDFDIPLIALKSSDFQKNLAIVRLLESLTYPVDMKGQAPPFVPPPVCTIQCGQILGKNPLCVVLETYSLKIDPSVPLDPITLLPIKFSISTRWRVVYNSENLPGQERIITSGY